MFNQLDILGELTKSKYPPFPPDVDAKAYNTGLHGGA